MVEKNKEFAAIWVWSLPGQHSEQTEQRRRRS